MKSRMLLEYDGTAFAGWARQPGPRMVLREDDLALTVAGRTDAGVHAWGQVCSYEHEAVDPLRLNALLPGDVAVLDCNPTADGFDARQDAVSRTYCYRVLHRRARSVWLARRALWHGWDLDRKALSACARALVGEHDFTAFTPTETEHRWFTRVVETAEWRELGERLELWITADAFLRHMTRTLVGTMLEVAQRRRSPEDFVALLEGAHRRDAGHTAKPHGLALAEVRFERRT